MSPFSMLYADSLRKGKGRKRSYETMKKAFRKRNNVQTVYRLNMMAVLAVCFILQAVLAVHADEYEPDISVYTDSQGIVYELTGDGTCHVSGYTENLGDTAVIPAQISETGSIYTVKGIRESAFAQCGVLKKLEISNEISGIIPGTFAGCRNLTDISVILTKTSVKKSGKTVTVFAKINGALLDEAKNVRLEFDKNTVNEAVSHKGTDVLTLMISVTDAGDGSIKNTMPGSIVLKSGAVKAIAKSGKDLKIRITDDANNDYYVKAAAESMEQLTGEMELMLREKETGDLSGTFRSDVKKAVRKNGLRADSIRILTFSFGNGEKTDVDAVFPVEDAKGMEAGSKVYVYRYDENKRTFAAVSYHPYTVSGQGNIQISIAKNGSFLVSKKPFQYMSRSLSDEFLKESGNTYYINKNGTPVCGWKKIGSEYYYFDRKNGKMLTDAKADGIKVNSSGAAEKTDSGIKKIQTMIKARKIVEQVTNASDSKSQKIEKCFRWIFQFPYKRYRRLQPIYRQAGWEVTFANDIFDRHQGCCVSEASALAFLFHECGYETVYVACDTSHAWVELNGRVYDPLFAEARGFSQYYNRSYEGYGMRAVLKRKI